MYTKIVIFVIISAVFATSISTAISSSPVAFGITSCFTPKGQDKTSFCTISGPSGKWYECTKGQDGVRRCVEVKSVIDNDIPPELKDAIDVATGDTQSNDTKVPKTGVLDEPGALSDDGSTEDGGDGDDTKVPKDPGGLNNDDGLTINPDLP